MGCIRYELNFVKNYLRPFFLKQPIYVAHQLVICLHYIRHSIQLYDYQNVVKPSVTGRTLQESTGKE